MVSGHILVRCVGRNKSAVLYSGLVDKMENRMGRCYSLCCVLCMSVILAVTCQNVKHIWLQEGGWQKLTGPPGCCVRLMLDHHNQIVMVFIQN